jgi:hypothetical protein
VIGNLTKKDPESPYEDNVQQWMTQLDRGIRKRGEQEKRWGANEDFEDMKQWRDDNDNLVMGNGNQPTVNKLGSYNRTYRSAVSYKSPGAKVRPKSASAWEMIKLPVIGEDGKPKIDPETGQVHVIEMTRAKARETLINDIISKKPFGWRDTITRVVKSGCLGYGVAMVGYSPTFETPLEKDTDDEVPVLEDGTIDYEAVFIMDPLTGLPMEDDNDKPIKKNRMPVWEEWFIDWVHYRHMIIDPDGGNDFMKHRWVCMEQVRTLEEVKADPLFKNTKDLQGTGSSLDDEEDSPRYSSRISEDLSSMEGELELVRLFHIYDFVKDRRIVLADGHPEALLDEMMPLGITHSPFAFFRPNERIGRREEFYPRPINTDLVPLVAENNDARKMLATARRRGLRKILVEKGMLDPTAMEKLTNDEDLEIVVMDKISQFGLDKTLHMVPVPPIGGDLYNNLNIISADFDEIGGMGSASRGKSTGDTATETNKLSQYEGTRYDFDREQLKDTLVTLLSKLDDSLDANMTVARAINVSGTAGQLHQVLLDRDMIACDVEIDIDLQEMTPTDDAVMGPRMIQFAQVIGQNQWMAVDESVVRPMAERAGIKDENFIKGLVKTAQDAQQKAEAMEQMQMQMAMAQAQMQAQAKGPGKDGKVPEGGVPENSAQEAMQTGAGQQIPRMQGGN